MASEKSFLGTGWSFPPSFDPRSKEVEMVSDVEDIRESLWILFSTSPGERVMHPAYGCGLKSLIFEHVTESTVAEIKDMIERAILLFEPRILLNNIEVDATDVYEGLIEIRVDYTIRATNSRSNMVYPFYIQEGTSVRLS